jgi:hypothetical protein
VVSRRFVRRGRRVAPPCEALYTTHNREVPGSNPGGAIPVPERNAAVRGCLRYPRRARTCREVISPRASPLQSGMRTRIPELGRTPDVHLASTPAHTAGPPGMRPDDAGGDPALPRSPQSSGPAPIPEPLPSAMASGYPLHGVRERVRTRRGLSLVVHSGSHGGPEPCARVPGEAAAPVLVGGRAHG